LEPLDDDTKIKQSKKSDFFIMIARKALKKHFKIWVNDLLFLSVFGEAETGRVIAKFLYQTDTNATATRANQPAVVEVFNSPIHNRPIDLSKFKAFLSRHCKN
jgi:hypothetical protein